MAFSSRSMADRKSTRLNSSHLVISYAVFCLKKKKLVDELAYDTPPGTRNPKRLQDVDYLLHHGSSVITAFNLQHIYFFFNDTATTEIYTLSLHDALPI